LPIDVEKLNSTAASVRTVHEYLSIRDTNISCNPVTFLQFKFTEVFLLELNLFGMYLARKNLIKMNFMGDPLFKYDNGVFL
jgi:hypothetical protein